jgi:3',5'-cyclic-nucleotide phosphodiesterase
MLARLRFVHALAASSRQNRRTMKVRALPSSTSDPARLHYVTSFLVDDELAIDAGCLGVHATPREQGRVRDVLLTHCHADHVATLPTFLENVLDERRDGPTVHGHAHTIATLRQDVFNDRLWPNFVALKVGADGHAAVKLTVLAPEKSVVVQRKTVTPVEVAHPVPTFGYLVDDGASAVLFSGDTGPTTRLWEVARSCERLKAVFLECSLPDEQAELAKSAGHLTPRAFMAELAKLLAPSAKAPLARDLRVLAFHVKARFREQTVAQLAAAAKSGLASGAKVEVVEFGRDYVF